MKEQQQYDFSKPPFIQEKLRMDLLSGAIDIDKFIEKIIELETYRDINGQNKRNPIYNLILLFDYKIRELFGEEHHEHWKTLVEMSEEHIERFADPFPVCDPREGECPELHTARIEYHYRGWV